MAHIRRSRQVFQGKRLSVHQADVELKDGSTHVFEHVRFGDVSAILPILADGRLVLIRQFRPAAGRSMIEIPAGHIEPGESPEHAARRELEEETGYTAAQWEQLTRFFPSTGKLAETMFLYLATELEPGRPRPDEVEELDTVIVTLAEAFDHVRTGEIGDAKTYLALLLAANQDRRCLATSDD